MNSLIREVKIMQPKSGVYVLALTLTLFALGGVGAMRCEAENASAPVIELKAEIPHMDRTQPVPSYLQAGVEFDQAKVEKMEPLEPHNVWFRIPAWMAGTWRYSTRQVTGATWLKTGRKTGPEPVGRYQLETSLGCQLDKLGNVWEFEKAPYRSHSINPNTESYSTTFVSEPIGNSASRLVTRSFQRNTLINLSTKLIETTRNMESISSYTQVGPNTFRREGSNKIFDEKGMPDVLTASWEIADRIAPFKQINSWEGRDLRALFRNYLINHNMSELVPDEVSDNPR